MIIFPYIFFLLILFALFFNNEFSAGRLRYRQVKQYGEDGYVYRGSFLLLSFLILFFVHIFKDPYSLPDLDQYLSGFEEVKRLSWSQLAKYGFRISLKAEPGWVILNKVISQFSGNFFWLLFITSFLILIGPYKTIQKYCPPRYVWIAVLLYFSGSFMQSLFVLRQHMAISICLLSIPSIISSNWKKYLLCCFIAISFHYSAIIWLPVYFICQIKSNKTLYLSLIVISILIIAAYSIVLPMVALYLDFGYNSFAVKDSEGGAKVVEAIMMGAVVCVYLFATKGKFFDGSVEKIFAVLLVLAFVFSIAGIGYPETGRLNMFYTRLIYIYIPLALYKQKSKTIRRTTGTILILLFLSVWLIHAFDPSVDYNGYKFVSF